MTFEVLDTIKAVYSHERTGHCYVYTVFTHGSHDIIYGGYKETDTLARTYARTHTRTHARARAIVKRCVLDINTIIYTDTFFVTRTVLEWIEIN